MVMNKLRRADDRKLAMGREEEEEEEERVYNKQTAVDDDGPTLQAPFSGFTVYTPLLSSARGDRYKCGGGTGSSSDSRESIIATDGYQTCLKAAAAEISKMSKASTSQTSVLVRGLELPSSPSPSSSSKKVDTYASAVDAEISAKLASYVPDTPEEKALVRKIDLYLMPTLWVMYILNYIDRTNIGNAKIAGMAADLGLGDSEYAWVLSIFFFGYLLCEVPSNMILSRSKPSIFLPAIMLVWGALSAIMALSKTYGALLGFRFILGCIESGFFPGVLYLLSCWYKKDELGKRFAVFYSAAILSGAFGGVFAGAITGHLEGARGVRGWRWLFIIEGVSTVCASIIAYFILLDFPSSSTSSSKFTSTEKDLAILRLLHDGIESGTTYTNKPRMSHWTAFKSAVIDWRTWAFTFLFMMDVGSGTISYFIPTLTKSLGYDTITAQYMTVPIYAIAAFFSNITAYSADRFSERRLHITVALGIGFISCVIAANVVHYPTIRYIMICFTASGIWSALPLILAWTSNVVSLPSEKRAVVIAIVNAFGNFSSVYGSRIWPQSSAPRYTVGFGVTASFLGVGALVAMGLPVLIRRVPYMRLKVEGEEGGGETER